MRGMDTVVAIRKARRKPAGVFVELVGKVDPGHEDISPSGIVTVQVPRSDRIASLDLRPLVGLNVQVFDYDSPARQRELAKLIAGVNPRRLAVHVLAGDAYTMHVREAGNPPKTRSYRT